MRLRYFEAIEGLLHTIEETQKENITAAAGLIAEAIENGGILQAFGSGHSYAGALEVCNRAGGLIPTKVIKEPSGGMYEIVNGVGEIFCEKLDVRKMDAVIMISNSGRNPIPIAIAEKVKAVGAKLIVVTSLTHSKEVTSLHVNGKKLYEYADVILDSCVILGDACLDVEGLSVKVGGTSSVATVALLQQAILESIEIMISHDYVPPVLMSYNVEGGREYNLKLLEQYAERLNMF